MISAGLIEVVRIGGRQMVLVESYRRLIEVAKQNGEAARLPKRAEPPSKRPGIRRATDHPDTAQ
jgi:hypothetical protein